MSFMIPLKIISQLRICKIDSGSKLTKKTINNVSERDKMTELEKELNHQVQIKKQKLINKFNHFQNIGLISCRVKLTIKECHFHKTGLINKNNSKKLINLIKSTLFSLQSHVTTTSME